MASTFINQMPNGSETFEIFGDDSSKIKNLSVTLDGIPTDILFCDYSEKQLLVITQFQKIGTFILLTKSAARMLDGTSDIYDIRTLSGIDNEKYHLVARYLSEQLDIVKPILFSICLKDHSLKTLRGIVKVLKDNIYQNTN